MELENTKKKYKVEIMEDCGDGGILSLYDEPTYYIDDLNKIKEDVVDDFLYHLDSEWLGHDFVAVVTETEDEDKNEIGYYYFSSGDDNN